MILGQEPLGFRRQGFSPCLSLLMPAFSLPSAPAHLAGVPSMQMERSPTTLKRVYGFGTTLSPVIFTAQGNLTSELLRFL
jgi:hypothetical protein